MIAAPLTQADVKTRLAGALDEILRLGVRRLALFGSVQRDAARPDSDVDLLVEFQPGQKSYDHFFALGELLERILERPVELVTPEALSYFLRQQLLATATDIVRAGAWLGANRGG